MSIGSFKFLLSSRAPFVVILTERSDEESFYNIPSK